MNEQIVRIVTTATNTTFVQVQDAVADPHGHVLVPPRLQAITQPLIYQVGEPLPSPEGAPQEPLLVFCIVESYDEVRVTDDNGNAVVDAEGNEVIESGDLIEYEVHCVGAKGSVYEKINRAIVVHIPASEIVRKDCRVSGDEMAQTLREYQQQAQPAPQQQRAQPAPQQQQPQAPEQSSPTTVGGMATAELNPLLQVNPDQEQAGATSPRE